MMDERYIKVYTHKGIGIYALRVARPSAGDELGYVVDDDRFRGVVYPLMFDAMDAIDKNDPAARQSYEAKR